MQGDATPATRWFTIPFDQEPLASIASVLSTEAEFLELARAWATTSIIGPFFHITDDDKQDFALHSLNPKQESPESMFDRLFDRGNQVSLAILAGVGNKSARCRHAQWALDQAQVRSLYRCPCASMRAG